MTRSPRTTIWIGVCFLAVLVGGILFRANQLCEGHFGYPIDDSYIHMAMAKNFALHGVWGVTRFGFSSSTSSPLFTLLLAVVYFVSGVHEITPLIINAFMAVVLITCIVWVFEYTPLSRREGAAALLLIVAATPLFALTLVGMEHVLHAVLSLVFLHLATRLLSGWDNPRTAAALLALTPFLVTARYEGTFLVLAAGVLFLLRGRWRFFVALGMLSALPIAIYGAISIHHGWPAFPTSLLLKANLPNQSQGGFREFVAALGKSASAAPHLPLLLLLASALLVMSFQKHRTVWTYPGTALLLFLIAGVLHFLVARVGWYFRYEAYLVVLGGVVVIGGAADLRGTRFSRAWRAGSVSLAVLLLIALGARGARALYLSPRAIRNIYDQQYQMARFVQQFYSDSTVVVNDIGAVCFLTEGRVLDPIGLGSIEAARARFTNNYSSQWLGAWASQQHGKIAIVYPNVEPPNQWPLLGAWSIPDRWIVGSAEVNVYAIDVAAASQARSQLQQFQLKLPRGVHWIAHPPS